MSKKIVDALKTKMEESKYTNLRPTEETFNSGYQFAFEFVYGFSFEFDNDVIISGKVIPKRLINSLELKYKNLVQQDKNCGVNHRLFAKTVFTEMFKYAGAKVPNDSVIERLITDYDTLKDMCEVPVSAQAEALGLLGLCTDAPSFRKQRICISCNDPNCLKFNFSMNEGVYSGQDLICDLHNSVEFKLKCKDGNVIYEDGKVLLTIPKELKNYKVSDKNLFDVIVEYFQKICEKLGFKFRTKVEHSLGKSLKVLNDVNVSHNKNLNLNLNN